MTAGEGGRIQPSDQLFYAVLRRRRPFFRGAAFLR